MRPDALTREQAEHAYWRVSAERLQAGSRDRFDTTDAAVSIGLTEDASLEEIINRVDELLNGPLRGGVHP